MGGKTISVKLTLQASTPFLELLAPGRLSAKGKGIDPTQPALMKTGKAVISARQPSHAATAPKESGKTNRASMLHNGWGVARVEQRLPGGNISFNWQGKSFESKAPATISAGDTLLIKTNTAGKKSFLEVVDVARALPEKAINLFKTGIAQSDPLKQALLTLLQSRNAPVPPAERPLPASLNSQLAALGTLLDHYTITPDKPLDGPRLGEMIRNSGHLYEALLSKELLSSEKPLHQIQQRDLKAMLLKLIEVSQSSEATPRTIQVAQSSERGAARIESQQAISLLALHQPEPFRIEFPLIVQGIITTVQMSISTDQEATRHELTNDAVSDESFTILFALDLSGLGNVDIDAHITSDSVHATIYPEDEKAHHFVQKHISRLSDRLDALGFNHLHLATSVKSRMSEKKQHAFECLNLGLPISKGVLDVTG